MTPKDSMEVRIARMDERIETLHTQLPKLIEKVSAHDRDIIAAKVVMGIGLILIAIKFPQIAEAIAKVIP